MKPGFQNFIQRIIVSTSFPPFTFLYRKIYAVSVAVATSLLKRIDGVSSIYLRRGVARGEIVYGLSDLDLLVIIGDEYQEAGLAKERIRATYKSLSRFIPLFGNVEKELGAYTQHEFFNLYKDHNFYRYRFNEGRQNWALLFGRDLLKALPTLEDAELYLPASEELKVWWQHLNGEFAPDCNEPLYKRKYLWYKAIAEASGIYLFICHGIKVRSRKDALREVRKYLNDEYQCLIDIVCGYLKHLTAKEGLPADELIKLFITLAGWVLKEAGRKVYGGSKGKKAIAEIPGCHEVMASYNLAPVLQKLAPYLDAVALIPQIEFKMDVLDNSDVDSFSLILVQKNLIPIEKLREFRSLFMQKQFPCSIEPFVVASGSIALSLSSDNPHHCMKSHSDYPLFFAMITESAISLQDNIAGGSVKSIQCYLPPGTFEETIRKRAAKIDAIITSKNIYKMKTLDFLGFFWGAARTKLLAISFNNDEIFIPLNSSQILKALIKNFPKKSDWLKSLHMEYTKELAGQESDSYRFFSQAVYFISSM